MLVTFLNSKIRKDNIFLTYLRNNWLNDCQGEITCPVKRNKPQKVLKLELSNIRIYDRKYFCYI